MEKGFKIEQFIFKSFGWILYHQNSTCQKIDPGTVKTPFPSNILGRDSNPEPYNRELNSLDRTDALKKFEIYNQRKMKRLTF